MTELKRIAVIATIALFFLMIASAKAATLTGNVAFTIKHANGTDINYKLYNVSSTSGSITLFNGGTDAFDNSGGGVWKREDVFPLAAATTTYAQYCIKVSGNWINVTNSTGYLKASLYDPLFWTYVNSTGADIRITNQTSQLYFWIESFNATTQQATIWVNLSTGSTELDVAYDNPNALPSEYNNGSKTFEFFDDFNTLSQHWITAAGAWAVSSSYLTPTSSASDNWIVNNETNLSNYVIYTKGVAGGSAYTQYGVICNAQGTTSTSAVDLLSIANGYLKIYEGYTGAWTVLASVAYTVPGGDEVLTMQYMTGTTLHGTVWDLTASTSASVSATVSYSDGFAGLFESPYTTAVKFDMIYVASIADPAIFSTPYSVNITTINATASVNSANYVAPALNITIPYQTFTLPALLENNWFNFSAEQGQFSANVTFSFTSTFTQTQTANFTELVVSSDVYVPANCTSNTLTLEFNTSDVPTGVVIYSYNLSVLVNGTQVNFTKTATENLGVWYFTVSLNNIKQGWHSVKVLLVYQPAYLNITVYDANNVTTLLDKTLNVTVYDSNFNVLTSATVNKTANISVVYAGKVFVRISNGIGVARQLETTITPGNTTHITFYFPSANVVIATLQFIDYTNSFSNATVIIKRYISRNVIVPVDVQKMTAQLQTTHYLIANTPYEVYVTNGEDTRDLGYISVAYSQTIQLVIGNILNVQAFPYVGVAFNISTSNNTISITYKTIKGTTSSVSVEITNSTGYEVYNTTLTTPEGKITYLITNPNESYYVSFHAENSFEPVNYKTIVSVSGVQFEPVLPVVSGGAALAISAQSLPVWARLMFFGGLGIFVALLFRRQNVAIGLTMSFAVLALFTIMGILPLSTNALWVLAILVVVAWFVWWRDRR